MFAAEHLPYQQTHSFSKIVIDYLEQNKNLEPFYSFAPTIDGIRSAIENRKLHPVDRPLLTRVLEQQYQSVSASDKVAANIRLLRDAHTFTICTAHQPNLFTGPLYFIYKILHAIRLAAYLNEQLPQYNFVPVYYMGSEDADLEELNHFTVWGKKYVWHTDQKGAVGRMKVDQQLTGLLAELASQLSVEPMGGEWIQLLKSTFVEGKNIQTATFGLVHQLFQSYGLIVLIPDHPDLKRTMIPVFRDDLLHHTPAAIVNSTSGKLNQFYDVQAHARPVNLFYLHENVRERIVSEKSKFKVQHSAYSFTTEGLIDELQQLPDRFSPNVILRGLLQETILPNITFIGGGGEVAYWLQLKDLFEYYKTPFPVLLLRNSFLLIDKKQQELISKLQLSTGQLFLSELDILNHIIGLQGNKPVWNGELDIIRTQYGHIRQIASQYDATLEQHVDALKTKTIKHLLELEKKMARAERKKHEATRRQIHKLKQQLFAGNSLQERVENIGGWYSRFGSSMIDELYKNALPLEPLFTVLRQTD